MDLRAAADRIDELTALDRVLGPARRAVGQVLPRGPVKDALHGTWLGHPLHPMLTDVTIGAWTSAFVLDLAGGRRARPAADRLVAVGVLSALPTAAAGLADWSELGDREARVGVVHAAANWMAIGCYAMSWAARRRDRRVAGVLWGLVGAGVASVGGYLGGHLSYKRGAGVARTAFEAPPTEWTDAAAAADVVEGRLLRGRAGSVDVALYRDGERVLAVADTCPHLGGPLADGEVVHGEGGPCVVCPWHGSTFVLATGAVAAGPASAPVPSFAARVVDGRVQVRLATAAATG